MSVRTPTKDQTKKRHLYALKRFQYWFERKRLRYDDAIRKVAEETWYSEEYVERIIHAQG